MKQNNKTYTICYDNNTCDFEKYTFSTALSFEFYNLHSKDGIGGKHKGMNIFRIDFTKVGRFECEFIDHTFAYRGENEITLMSTQESEEWILESNFPAGMYMGCAFLIKLDNLSVEDSILLDKFNIDIFRLISSMNLNYKWHKFTGSNKLIGLFNDIYNVHTSYNSEIILLRVLEILSCISKSKFYHNLTVDSEYFSGEQVKKVKTLHSIITKNYNKTISLKEIVSDNGMGYSTFNKIFKSIYGESPYQYLKKFRMNFAAKKLHETELNILEIAISVGYNNPSKFSNAFKSIFGILPSTFRKQKNGMEHKKQ